MSARHLSTFFIGLLLILTTVAANVQVSSFIATYQGLDIRLDWSIAEENGVSAYDIYKRIGEENAYEKIGSVAASGQKSYMYIDDNLYKSESQSPQSISYRLTVKTAQGNTNYFSTIQHNPTAVQRSWGSIKSMFK